MNVHLKKLIIESKGKPEQKSYAACGTNFRISKCFQQCWGSVTFGVDPDPDLGYIPLTTGSGSDAVIH